MTNCVLGIGLKKMCNFIGSIVRLYVLATNMYVMSNTVRGGPGSLKNFGAALKTKCNTRRGREEYLGWGPALYK
jgi:hypothetical protein